MLSRSKANNSGDTSQGPKPGPSVMSPAGDTTRADALRRSGHSTEINSTISSTEGPVNLNSPLLIAGFPGPRLIGSISTSYIIESLNMQQIACVESEFIMPGVIYVDGKLRHPSTRMIKEQFVSLFVKPRY
jgi:hypothetical protein